MCEILLYVLIWKAIGSKMLDKGRNPLGYQFLAIGMMIGFELTGGIAGAIIGMAGAPDPDAVGSTPAIVGAVAGLLCGIASAVVMTALVPAVESTPLRSSNRGYLVPPAKPASNQQPNPYQGSGSPFGAKGSVGQAWPPAQGGTAWPPQTGAGWPGAQAGPGTAGPQLGAGFPNPPTGAGWPASQSGAGWPASQSPPSPSAAGSTTFQATCPQGHLLQGPLSMVGQRVSCPMCGQIFIAQPKQN